MDQGGLAVDGEGTVVGINVDEGGEKNGDDKGAGVEVGYEMKALWLEEV